jgi:hypothetical protein
MVLCAMRLNQRTSKCLDKIIFSEILRTQLINYQDFAETASWKAMEADRRIRDADANENFGIENVLESSMNRIQSLLNYKLAYGRTETKKSLSL